MICLTSIKNLYDRNYIPTVSREDFSSTKDIDFDSLLSCICFCIKLTYIKSFSEMNGSSTVAQNSETFVIK